MIYARFVIFVRVSRSRRSSQRRVSLFIALPCNPRKYYYGYNYALTRVLMNANSGGQYRADTSLQPKPNHARSRNYIRLTDNCVKWKLQARKLAIAIGPLFRLRTGILGNCSHSRGEGPMRHESPLWSRISGPSRCRNSFRVCRLRHLDTGPMSLPPSLFLSRSISRLNEPARRRTKSVRHHRGRDDIFTAPDSGSLTPVHSTDV